MRRIALVIIILRLAATGLAQTDACPALQQRAAANIAQRCADQDAGTLCLGQETVSPVLRRSASDAPALKAPGDALPLPAIDWLSVSSEDKTWGAARALLTVYPDDSLEAQEAALLAFGNVALFFPEPAEAPATLASIRVTASAGANLRASPNTDSRIIARLARSRELKAIGAATGGQWLLVYATPSLRGWISQSVVSQPLERLPALAADAETAALWRFGQRFDFQSGMDDAPCPQAPESGILLQTPEFGSPIPFAINGARLRLKGLAWLQAQVSGGMFVHLLDGGARLSSADGDVALSDGGFSSFSLQRTEAGDLAPASPPSAPQAYDYHELIKLPVDALPQRARVGLDRHTLVDAAPDGGGSPLEALAIAAPCRFSAVLAGANIRSRPDPKAPIIAVMPYRESAEPIARGIGVDSLPWWKLAESVWVRVDATVAGGNCNAVPLIRPDA